MEPTAEQMEFRAAAIARANASREAKAKERGETIAELGGVEDKWLDLKDRLDSAGIATAFGFRHEGEWTFYCSGDRAEVIKGLTDAINRAVDELEGEHVFEIDRLENPEDHEDD